MTALGSIAPNQVSVSGRQVTLDSKPGSPDSPNQRKLKQAAGEFESILLASMWKSMKQSFGSSDTENDSDPAHGTLDDWGIEIMSSAVGKAGGLGIGKLILKHLQPEADRADSTGTSAGSVSAHFAKVLADSADVAVKRRVDATP